MRRTGRAGAAGLWRGGGGEGGRVSESGSRAGGLPPSSSSGGVGLPAASLASLPDWLPGPRKLAFAIGPRSCKFRPSAGWRGRQGGARRFRPSPRPRAAESGPAPLRNVAGSARWRRGWAGCLSRGAGAGAILPLSCSHTRDERSRTCTVHSWERRKERGLSQSSLEAGSTCSPKIGGSCNP